MVVECSLYGMWRYFPLTRMVVCSNPLTVGISKAGPPISVVHLVFMPRKRCTSSFFSLILCVVVESTCMWYVEIFPSDKDGGLLMFIGSLNGQNRMSYICNIPYVGLPYERCKSVFFTEDVCGC